MEVVDIDKKLFNQYPVKFPINKEKLVIIHGMNGSGKTLTMEAVKEYYEEQEENVLYFPIDRWFTLTEDQVIASEVAYKLTSDYDVFSKFNIKFSKFDFEYHSGQPISSGNIQIVNFICNIVMAPANSIVMIDCPESNLDIHKKRSIIDDLLSLENVKKLIVITNSPEVMANYWDNTISIEKCVKLR